MTFKLLRSSVKTFWPTSGNSTSTSKTTHHSTTTVATAAVAEIATTAAAEAEVEAEVATEIDTTIVTSNITSNLLVLPPAPLIKVLRLPPVPTTALHMPSTMDLPTLTPPMVDTKTTWPTTNTTSKPLRPSSSNNRRPRARPLLPLPLPAKRPLLLPRALMLPLHLLAEVAMVRYVILSLDSYTWTLI
jgi:hypothetical protein